MCVGLICMADRWAWSPPEVKVVPIAGDVLQMLIHLAQPIGGGPGQRIQERDHSGHVLCGPSEGGKLPFPMVGCCGLIYLER
jgi:hypothetical protein